MALFRAQANVLGFRAGDVVDVDGDDPEIHAYIHGRYLEPVEIEDPASNGGS
jgi:hypothetical protein